MKAEAMRIALIRHATREQNGNADKTLGLTSCGIAEAEDCGGALFERGFCPTVCFTSWYAHARQTAEIISSTIAQLEANRCTPKVAPSIVELCTLTPQFPGSASWLEASWREKEKWDNHTILDWIVSETKKTGYDLSETDAAVFVMHQPRMQQLLAEMTGKTIKISNTGFSEGICLQAPSLHEFVEGRGKQDGSLILHKSKRM
jgi:phosphohistidine phosphatase SixA